MNNMPQDVCCNCNNIYQGQDAQYRCNKTDEIKDMFDSCIDFEHGEEVKND